MTYAVVYQKNLDGHTSYGICGAYSSKSEAEEYIQSNPEENVRFTIAEFE